MAHKPVDGLDYPSKRLDAANLAVEGFWARPSGSGDGIVDIENYSRGLVDRIGWTGTREELQQVLEKSLLDTDTRAEAKSKMRSSLAYRINDQPTGEDPYLPEWQLPNDEIVRRIRVKAKAAANATDDREFQSSYDELTDLTSMLDARVSASGNPTVDERRFLHEITRASNAVCGTDASAERALKHLDVAAKSIPDTPDYVTVREVAPEGSYGPMSENDRNRTTPALAALIRKAGAAVESGDLPPAMVGDEAREKYQQFAREHAAGLGYTGSEGNLAANIAEATTRLSDPDPLGGEVDRDELISEIADDMLEDLDGLPRTERSDGTRLGDPDDVDPVHLNMADAVLRGYTTSPYADTDDYVGYAADVAPKIGFVGDPTWLREPLELAALQHADGECGATADFAEAIAEGLPQAGEGPESNLLRSRFAEGDPFGDQVGEWGMDEPGYGTVRANATHVFRKAGRGWETRPKAAYAGDGAWRPGSLPMSAKIVKPSAAAEALGGRCVNCGKELQDATRHGGFGPECVKKV